jgi:Protein kinase domain
MVMELIEGEALAQRIQKGPIPLDQSLKLATQFADALDRAHRAGVTHRDVKPQNIMLTRDGVKILDFGLAKSQARPGPTEDTLTRVLTTEGTVMGTPQYMAPEQFGGKEADARSDIWAFGAVLYEMVTGRKAFHGSNYQSLVGATLATDPPGRAAIHPGMARTARTAMPAQGPRRPLSIGAPPGHRLEIPTSGTCACGGDGGLVAVGRRRSGARPGSSLTAGWGTGCEMAAGRQGALLAAARRDDDGRGGQHGPDVPAAERGGAVRDGPHECHCPLRGDGGREAVPGCGAG